MDTILAVGGGGGLVQVYRKNGGQGLLNIEASFVTFHYLIFRIVKSNRNTFLQRPIEKIIEIEMQSSDKRASEAVLVKDGNK